jgi:hypothetical protein
MKSQSKYFFYHKQISKKINKMKFIILSVIDNYQPLRSGLKFCMLDDHSIDESIN